MSTISKSLRGLAILAALGAVFGAFAGPVRAEQPDERHAKAKAAPASSNAQVRSYTITASEGGIIPGHIRIKRGDTVRITFVSKDDNYGIRFKDFDIKQKLTPEKPVMIEIRPSKAGTYEFKCARPFGVGRLTNNGALYVTE